jgi:hypothetical protein
VTRLVPFLIHSETNTTGWSSVSKTIDELIEPLVYRPENAWSACCRATSSTAGSRCVKAMSANAYLMVSSNVLFAALTSRVTMPRARSGTRARFVDINLVQVPGKPHENRILCARYAHENDGAIVFFEESITK